MSAANVYHNHHGLWDPHHPHAPIPDYKFYKLENASQPLKDYQKRITGMGLKDPWIRNEVWRYPASRTGKFVFWNIAGRGMKWGLVAALISTFIHYNVDAYYVPRVGGPPREHHH